jgi:ribosomal protein S18 acetylase RimI-like enzyme
VSTAEGVRFRRARPEDAAAIAALHADSWRRNYRGAYSDAFLDGDVLADRMGVWTGRLQAPHRGALTLVAEHDGVVGFAHAVFDEDARWGALLDNIHVADVRRRSGLGSRLLALTAAAVVQRPSRTGLYLWVLEQNVGAQAFYRACGGSCVERSAVSPPGGIASRLAGSPMKLRYAWRDPGALCGEEPGCTAHLPAVRMEGVRRQAT